MSFLNMNIDHEDQQFDFGPRKPQPYGASFSSNTPAQKNDFGAPQRSEPYEAAAARAASDESNDFLRLRRPQPYRISSAGSTVSQQPDFARQTDIASVQNVLLKENNFNNLDVLKSSIIVLKTIISNSIKQTNFIKRIVRRLTSGGNNSRDWMEELNRIVKELGTGKKVENLLVFFQANKHRLDPKTRSLLEPVMKQYKLLEDFQNSVTDSDSISNSLQSLENQNINYETLLKHGGGNRVKNILEQNLSSQPVSELAKRSLFATIDKIIDAGKMTQVDSNGKAVKLLKKHLEFDTLRPIVESDTEKTLDKSNNQVIDQFSNACELIKKQRK
ncbi:unnamed protein product [Didymodactylos carnosus]|uniref:Uncharacterized protein n=1 Tax=Didymodactylos carnosus TaxID=1234261 RepID=A0A815X1N7_9BILA|nr:unnamed protein product [Didymodactylos carnosus]CAF4411865.1 unnamed protein product [Didymodactylos carnosus]